MNFLWKQFLDFADCGFNKFAHQLFKVGNCRKIRSFRVFLARADNQTLKLRLGAAQGLLLMAFTPEMNGGQINCGARKPENFVVATYKTATDAKAKAAGEIVALEFVPNNFKLKQ